MLFYKEKTGENMELDNINIGNGLELAQIGNPIPNECFKELVETIRDCYKRLGIKTEEMHLEYQRFPNANSVLAIKLAEGSNQDKENYMFVGSSAHQYSDKIHCDVFLHADAKCAQRAVDVSGIISRKIVNFFEKTEEELHNNGMSDMEFSVRIPLSEEKEHEYPPKKDNRIIQFMKKFYKNKKS